MDVVSLGWSGFTTIEGYAYNEYKRRPCQIRGDLMPTLLSCDIHTHTMSSAHAYSTIEENVLGGRAWSAGARICRPFELYGYGLPQ